MRIVIFSVAVFLAGCAGVSFKSSERWVERHTLYSTSSPSIELQVSLYFKYSDAKAKGSIVEISGENLSTGVDTETFYFDGKKYKKSSLLISFDSLNANSRFSMKVPDYSKKSIFFMSPDHKMIGGINFDTAILLNILRGPSLVKAFGAVVEEKTRFQIMYMEEVDSSWLEKDPALLTNDDLEFVSKFNKRADNSFSISPYSGQLVPVQ